MESFLQCFPVMTTWLPFGRKDRNKKKIFLYKTIFKIFKKREKDKGEKRKESQGLEKETFDSSEDLCSFNHRTGEEHASKLYLKNCPCKICEITKSMSILFE